jgi:hypothetical protein
MEPELFKDAPEGTVPMISDGRFTNKELFVEGEADKWMQNYPRLGIPQSDICLIFRNAYENVANMNTAKERFQVTGLRPAKPGVLSDEDFLASDFINRPQGNMKEDPPGETGKELHTLMSVSIEKKAAEGSTSSNSPKNLYCCTVHSEDSLIIKHQQMHYYILCLF